MEADLFAVLQETGKITLFVFLMMVLVDWLNVLSRGRIPQLVRGGLWRQYLVGSFLGATPGCLGAFMDVTLYCHGLLTFGALVGAMIATSGDEAFVMLSLFPGRALLLFSLLFVMGIGFSRVTDWLVPLIRLRPVQPCKLQEFHPLQVSWSHYLKKHILDHILRKHLWQIFLWTFFALLFMRIGLQYLNLETLISQNLLWILLISGLIGLIPESGPHLIFVMMYARGVIPFSILLTSSFVQDGHGMLPLIAYAPRDALRIKLFNLIFGLGIGGLFLTLGW
jgi:hypothetical protein